MALPALTTTTTISVHTPSEAGVAEDVALAGKDLPAEEKPSCESCVESNDADAPEQPKPVENYGFYIFYIGLALTRNLILDKVKVQFREGVWDGHTIFS